VGRGRFWVPSQKSAAWCEVHLFRWPFSSLLHSTNRNCQECSWTKVHAHLDICWANFPYRRRFFLSYIYSYSYQVSSADNEQLSFYDTVDSDKTKWTETATNYESVRALLSPFPFIIVHDVNTICNTHGRHEKCP
jgi:hypothetical protein